jgi:hypothetical protein
MVSLPMFQDEHEWGIETKMLDEIEFKVKLPTRSNQFAESPC